MKRHSALAGNGPRTLKQYALLIGFLLTVAAAAFAQTESATLSGTVMDKSGAVVSNAQVQVTNSDTNIAVSTKTNDAGIYLVPALKPGRYRLAVTKQGFKQVVVTDVVLNVQDMVSRNFTLEVGATSESVTVTAEAERVNTTNATVSTVVDRQFAENLPLNGRSFQSLIQLAPGVVVVPTNVQDNGQFSVNGQRAASNYWTVDGVSANIGVGVRGGGSSGNGMAGALGSSSALGGTNSLVSVDAMQEFRIQTSTYAAEYGRTPGGQISIVTRSGANQFHGTLFDYFRNDVLDANDWFANNKGLPKPQERQNDFGGTFSGPILKDRTFFFFSYEGLRLRLPQVQQTTVPSLTARQNAIPAMQPFLNAYPLPDASAPVIRGASPFDASFSNKATLDAYSLRIDHRVSNKLALFGRYNYSPSEIIQRGGFARALSVVEPIQSTTQTGTAGATWSISPNIANDLRFNYSRTDAFSHIFLDDFGGAVPLAALPFPSPFTSQNGRLIFRIIALLNGQLADGQSNRNVQRQINVVDSVSVQKSSHSLKFGADFRRLSPVQTPAQYFQNVVFFPVAAAQTGNAFQAVVVSKVPVSLLFHNLGVFAQDTWRVAPRFTLTYGLRWDVDFAPSSLEGPSLPAVTGFNLNDFSQLAIAPAGSPPFRTSYGNVAPRIGVAYQLDQHPGWETVLRGGFGVFYDLASTRTANLLHDSAPFTGVRILVRPTFPLSPANSAPPSIASSATIAFVSALNPDLKLPYTLQWNVAFEQALGQQQGLSLTYVGAAGRRLLQTTSVFFPPSNANIVFGTFADNSATSDYHALQVQFQRRLSHGLQALASYTWSHSIDTGSASSGQISSNQGVPGSNANRGPSDFDIRHAFSAALTYQIPAPKTNAFARAILRGWSLQNVIQARSAPPVNVSDLLFFVNNNGVFADTRPDLVPGQPLYLFGAQFPGGKALNAAAFTDPPIDPITFAPLRQGNLGRNALRGFGAVQWDFAVHRDFSIRESLKVQFRAEMFNALNHPNFGPPSGFFISPAFGGPLPGFGVSSQMLGQSLAGPFTGGNGSFNPLYQIGGPRSVQFALKLSF